MRRRWITTACLTAAVGLVGLSATATSASAAPSSTSRIQGGDRYATAAAVSQALVPTPASDQTVYVASGENFPDALAAGPATLQGTTPAPLLLVPKTGTLPASVTAELDRLHPTTIRVIGGASAVAPDVAQQLTAWDATPERISGFTRFGTAAAVAAAAGIAPGGTVFLATGLNYPDALAASAVAARDHSALLLTAADVLPTETATALTSTLKPSRVVVLGATGVVSDAVVGQVKAALPGAAVQRIGGGDRYETAALVSQLGFPGTAGGAFLATGTNFPDALAAGPLAATEGQPLLLTQSGCAPAATAAEFTRLKGSSVTVLGGAAVVSDAAASLSACAAPPPPSAPPGRSYGSGTLLVGKDIPSGTYLSTRNSGCYWERDSDTSGELTGIIANDINDGQAVVTILPTDVAFASDGCGPWTAVDLTPRIQPTIGEGNFLVNVHIAPGTYQARPTDSCYWERSSASTGDLDAILANDVLDAGSTATVTVKASDVLFTSSGCGTWTKVS